MFTWEKSSCREAFFAKFNIPQMQASSKSNTQSPFKQSESMSLQKQDSNFKQDDDDFTSPDVRNIDFDQENNGNQDERVQSDNGQRVGTIFSDEEEMKQDEKATPIETKKETDFVKDTFAKFGLNMNLYNPSLIQPESRKEANDREQENDKVQRILDMLPDYGFLLEPKLALPQTLFMAE